MLSRAIIMRGGVPIRLAGSGLASVLCGLALGCGHSTEGYEPHLRYPARTDPIVLAVPPERLTGAPDPMAVEDFLAELPKRGGKILSPSEIPAAERAAMTRTLDGLFGTPAAPSMPARAISVGALALDADTMAKGSASYRVRCGSCHGTAGDGRGIGAGYPYPRDFRSGQFKRTTGLAANGKPRVEDLHRVIRGGVPGTSMPLFDLLPDGEVDALTAYVIHLSIRGEVEAALIAGLCPDSEDGIADVDAAARTFAAKAHRNWLEAQSPAPKYEPRPSEGGAQAESIRRGHRIFVGNGCLSCHEGYGRKPTYLYDSWGLPNRPQDLTQREYRWGREPEDLARAVWHGIKPANMPAAPLKDGDLDDVVEFLRALPFPAQLPADVRGEVERGSR